MTSPKVVTIADVARAMAEAHGRSGANMPKRITIRLRMNGLSSDELAVMRIRDMIENLCDETWRDYDAKHAQPPTGVPRLPCSHAMEYDCVRNLT